MANHRASRRFNLRYLKYVIEAALELAIVLTRLVAINLDGDPCCECEKRNQKNSLPDAKHRGNHSDEHRNEENYEKD
jgi:hypothetical protein